MARVFKYYNGIRKILIWSVWQRTVIFVMYFAMYNYVLPEKVKLSLNVFNLS